MKFQNPSIHGSKDMASIEKHEKWTNKLMNEWTIQKHYMSLQLLPSLEHKKADSEKWTKVHSVCLSYSIIINIHAFSWTAIGWMFCLIFPMIKTKIFSATNTCFRLITLPKLLSKSSNTHLNVDCCLFQCQGHFSIIYWHNWLSIGTEKQF